MLTVAWVVDMLRYTWLLLHLRTASAGDSRRSVRRVDGAGRREEISLEFWQR